MGKSASKMVKPVSAMKSNDAKDIHLDRLINGRYRIVEKLGAGSFGEIFLAEDENTKEQIAVKMEPVNVSPLSTVLSIQCTCFSRATRSCSPRRRSTT